jgi:pilus assembly protein CpaB
MFATSTTIINKYPTLGNMEKKMNKLIRIVIAIVCGIIGTLGIIIINKPQSGSTVYKDIVVASQDLYIGKTLDDSVIAKKSVPEAYVDPLAIPWERRQDLYGQKLMIRVLKGTQILWGSLESSLQKDFENRIPKGCRALSINVSSSTGVSGLLQPGSHVDIIGMFTQTIEAGNITPATRIQVLLQNITVLAAGRMTSTISSDKVSTMLGTSSSYSTITVAVTLEEAETLIAADARGKLYCVLRNPAEDLTPVQIEERTLNEALGNEAISRINNQRFKNSENNLKNK